MYNFAVTCARFGVAVMALIMPVVAFATEPSGSTSPTTASCPFSGGIIVNFSERIYSDSTYDAHWDDVPASIPAGRYKVSLSGSDSYSWRNTVSQPNEKYYVEFYDGGSTVAKTNSTKDLPDYVVTGVWTGVVNNELNLSRSVNKIAARHTAYPDTSSPNSLNPTCIQLLPIEQGPVCGNGIKESGEQCDDGNTNNYDGCSSTCQEESPVCGNGRIETGEQCDDGNTNSNDGCSAQCKAETAAITIDKDDNDNKDDTQEVAINGDAIYFVTVTNTGKVSLTNVVVTDVVSPNCNRSAAQTQKMYSGTTFDPGESFSYRCTEPGVTASHGSTARVTGDPINNASQVSDSDSTNVTVKDAPAITIDKNDADNKDDTQEVKEGGTATYTVVVTNNGVSPLTNVIVTDNDSPDCSRSAAQTKAMYPGDTFDPGESFEYQCTESNVTTSHSTTASVVGTSTVGGQKVSDSDDTRVTVNGAAAITIDKNDADNGDDMQTVKEGSSAKFTITVKNSGTVALKDVVVTDVAAPGCALSAAQTKAKYDGDTFDPGESFKYTCTASVSNSFINTAKVTAKTVSTGASVDDKDTSKVNVEGRPPVEEPEDPEEEEDPDCDGSIGNTIWHDKNANGKQDAGEPGIPGVRLWLYKGNKVFKDTTNSQGRYKFKGLCAGTFRLVVKSEDISALYQTYDPDGKLDHRTKVRLKGDNDHHTKADFGYRGAVAPATGPGTVISIILAALATGFILYFYRRKRMRNAA